MTDMVWTITSSITVWVKISTIWLTLGIESFCSMLKRGYQGIFYRVSHWHLNHYVNEFCGRHNIRDWGTMQMMLRMATGTVGK